MVDISVVCNCYNHAPFLVDAIEGFLSQRGDFSMEILINDDASTDGSQDILKGYAEEYPGTIRTWLHTQNQYSQGIPFVREVVIPASNGRYIAFCEGDDYWISPYKLERQLEFMESNQKFAGCLHNCYVIDYLHNDIYLSEVSDRDRDKSICDIVVEGGGLVNPTASMFYRRESMDGFFPNNAPVGDHFTMIRAATHGPIRWFAEPLSCYRFGSPESFTTRMWNSSSKQSIDYHERYVASLCSVFEHLPVELRTHEVRESFVNRVDLQRLEMDRELSFKRQMKTSVKNHLPSRLRLKLTQKLQQERVRREGRLVHVGLDGLISEIASLRVGTDGKQLP